MKKTGGIALIIVGAVLILLALDRAFVALLVLTSNEQSDYGSGVIIGAAFMAVLLTLIGIKSIKKGRELFSAQSTQTTPSE